MTDADFRPFAACTAELHLHDVMSDVRLSHETHPTPSPPLRPLLTPPNRPIRALPKDAASGEFLQQHQPIDCRGRV
jgi:hypothetical protein